MNSVLKALSASILFFCYLPSSHGSFVGDSINISGIPSSTQTSATISQINPEATSGAPGGVNINFACDVASNGQFTCGFAQTPTDGFVLDIFELSNGSLQMDVSLWGVFPALDVSLSGLDSTSQIITGTSLIGETRDNRIFVDPSTGVPVEPLQYIPYGVASLASDLTLTHSDNGVGFSLPSNEYSNTFSVLIQTTAVPVPAAVWLFGSALAGLLGIRFRPS